jgi:hypothetical protein
MGLSSRPPDVDGEPKTCGPVAHRLGELIASQIAAILYARGCPRGILALLPAAVGPVAQLEMHRTAGCAAVPLP